MADLPLLRRLLAIRQKSREPRFWEVIYWFVLLAYASFAASRTLLQRLLACLNFTLESEDLSYWFKRKKWFLWNMAAAQAAENHGDEWSLTWYFLWEIYTSISTWTHSQNSPPAAEVPSLKKSNSNDHEDHPNQHENSHKLFDETGRLVVNLMESQWKLRQQHDQNFWMEGKPLCNKY